MRNLRQQLNEEVVPNPQNPKAPLLFIRQTRVAATDDPNDKTKVNGVLISDKPQPAANSIFNADELAVIEQQCPEMIGGNARRGKSLSLAIKQDQIDSPETQAKITKLAQALTATGNYGTVDPQTIIDQVKTLAASIIDSDTLSGIHKDSLKELEEYIMRMTTPEALEAMSKINVYAPMNNVSYQLSMRNVDLIRAQNKKRIAAGLPAATYIVSPDTWFEFGRKVKPGAQPIYYWAPCSTGYTQQNIISAIDHLFGQKMDTTSDAKAFMDNLSGTKNRDQRNNVKQNSKRFNNPHPTYYNIFPYYDITDTVLINPNVDPWNDPERIGVINNIENNELTPAALSQVIGDDEDSKKWMERLTSGEFEDNPELAIDVCNALHNIINNMNSRKRNGEPQMFVPQLKTDENGKINIEAVKESVFKGVTELACQFLSQSYANKENYIQKAEMVACLYVGKKNIDSKKAAQEFAKLNRNTYHIGIVNGKEVYLTLDPKTNKYMYRPSKISDPKEYTGEVKTFGFKDELTRVSFELQSILYKVDSTINNQLKDDFEKNGQQNVSKKYQSLVAESFEHSITFSGLETYNDLGGSPKFRKMMNEIYNYIDMCNKFKIQEMKSRLKEETNDDWFAPELTDNDFDNDYENQELNDFYNQREYSPEVADEEMMIAESKFYDFFNRINK